MKVATSGYLYGARFIASPNFDERPLGHEISLLVIHSISLPPDTFGGNGVIELFTNKLNPGFHPCYRALRKLRVSAHFFICRNGAIIQFVLCTQRAWHAGESCWQGMTDCNDFSIGIELEGNDTQPFTHKQYTTLSAATLALREVYPLADIAGHSDISPGRKTDPGFCFDWKKYRSSL